MGLQESLQALAILILCMIHLIIGRMHFLHRGKGWLSFSGGAASAYVFVYILPKLGYQQMILSGAVPQTGWLGYLQHHAYLVAFAGFLIYFGASRAGQQIDNAQSTLENARHLHPVETLHVLSLALSALLVGYLVADYDRGNLAHVILGTIALALHFIGADHVTLKRYGALYDRFIRWILAGFTLVGAGIGAAITVGPTVFALWFGFLAGAMIVGILEEELPEGNQASFWWFLAGGVLFSALSLGLNFSAV